MNDTFLMLGIESSCDETAAALVKSDGSILASEVASQMEVHAVHGGVVPEIAARAHLDAIDLVIGRAIETCLLYTSPSPRDRTRSRMPSSA